MREKFIPGMISEEPLLKDGNPVLDRSGKQVILRRYSAPEREERHYANPIGAYHSEIGAGNSTTRHFHSRHGN